MEKENVSENQKKTNKLTFVFEVKMDGFDDFAVVVVVGNDIIVE